MPDKIGGVPTHPLIVHIPVVMVPLALIAVVAYFFIPAWRRQLVWVAGILAAGGSLGAILAAASGESLREHVANSKAVADHAEMGETARLLAFVFFLAVAALVVYQEIRTRRAEPQDAGRLVAVFRHRLMFPALVTVLSITGAAAVWGLVAAGHAGAKITWERVDQRP
jgi:uncharacterized membrane protein